MERSESPAPTQYSESRLREFLFQLTTLSQKYGLGIAGKPVLFVLEKDDKKRIYSANAESELSYE